MKLQSGKINEPNYQHVKLFSRVLGGWEKKRFSYGLTLNQINTSYTVLGNSKQSQFMSLDRQKSFAEDDFDDTNDSLLEVSLMLND